VGRALEIDAKAIAEGIRQLRVVPGRVEKVANDRGITILVDYAHSPDALEKVLSAVRPLSDGRLICVFGCGGDRDRGKRPLMGEIAARLSDLAVLTSDNPRSEEPLAIIAEVEAGVKKAGAIRLDEVRRGAPVSGKTAAYWVEADRRNAIRAAIDAASSGDLVLIAGKGHEDYQILGPNKIHFDDREVAREEAARANF
jgi:UDP-N-acetylmuramoyl-L-alanyl-D-glutamate--2,6-diaminopimelate ligase